MCAISGICHAQNDFIAIDAGGGINALSYKTDSRCSAKHGPGITVRGGYRHFFDKYMGVGINAVFKTCSTSCTLDYTEIIPDAIDSEGEQYEHRVNFSSLKEKQKQNNISLPAGFYYQRGINRSWEMTAGVGILFQWSVSNSYNIADGKVETLGYYAADNITFDAMPQHDFYSINQFSGEYKYKPSMGVYLEAGLLHPLKDNLLLSLSLYASYGLTSCMDDKSEPLYDYKTQKYNGVLNSPLATGKKQIAFGVLVGICIGRSGGGAGGHPICPAYCN